MEPNSNPPQSKDPISRVLSHEKIITPLNSTTQPEEPVTDITVDATANSVPPTISSTPQPAQASVAELAPPVRSMRPETATHGLRNNLWEACFVFSLASVAGAMFHLWYRGVVYILPSSQSSCSNITHDSLSFACRGTLSGDFVALITLFSLISCISHRLLKRSNVLAFYYGGLFVASLFFLETALLFDSAAMYKMRWLLNHGSLWVAWLTPALVSGIFALVFYLLIRYTPPIIKTLMGFMYVGLIILCLLFMPGAVKSFIGQQSQAGHQEAKKQITEKIKEFDITLYATKNYTGPLKLALADIIFANTDLVPRYELTYQFPNPYPDQSDKTIVRIYKGSSDDFNPPTNCGSGSPTSKAYKSKLTYPCKVVLKTKRGREVYGYRPLSELQYYKIDPNSDDIKKIQPNTFYIPMGDLVISFDDPSRSGDNESPLTPTVVGEFVDSLEPLTGAELERFANQYILLLKLY